MGLTNNLAPLPWHNLNVTEDNDLEVLIKTTTEPSPPVMFGDDPIALSWASYGVWKKYPARRWTDLNDVEAYPHDREMAATTRKYYRDRYTMDMLKGKLLTEFQTTLLKIITGDGPILKDQVGILMKLPYFYVEDTTLDLIFEKTNGLEEKKFIAENKEDTITPIGYTFASRRRFEIHQYWFVNSKYQPTCLTVQNNNPLASIVKSLHAKNCPISVRANWHYAQIRGAGRGNRIYLNLGAVELL